MDYTKRGHIPEDDTLQNHCCENLKYDILSDFHMSTGLKRFYSNQENLRTKGLGSTFIGTISKELQE
jgi:hypothetical protein